MMKRLKKIFNLIINKIFKSIGLGGNGSDLFTRNSDIFIVGYPKSGNTFLNHLIANYVSKKEINFKSIENVVSDIYFNNALILNLRRSPRFLKSHETYNSKYNKVIYILRDPRAVVVSYFYFLKALGIIKIDKTLDSFVDDFISSDKSFFYGGWNNHLCGWYEAYKYSSNIHFVKYENLLNNTSEEFSKILKFIGYKIQPLKLMDAVKISSLKNMRMLENQSDLKDDYKIKYSFMRAGITDDWKKKLNDKQIKKINKKFEKIMKKFKYI